MSSYRHILAGFFALIFSFAPGLIAEEGVDGEIQSPSSYLRIDIGEDRVLADWQQILSYFDYVAEHSPRVSLRELGESEGGRRIITALIAAPEHVSTIDDLIAKQQELTFNPVILPENELFDGHPAFVLINTSIHSTEVGPAQFSLQLLHRLATDNSAEINAVLQNCVVSLIPSPNPDGIDLVVDWYRDSLGTDYEGQSPPFLYQKYSGHDNNRDWFMLNLKETRVVTEWINTFLPVVLWDAHQMGSSGYRAIIPPFTDPPNPKIHPLVLSGIENAGHSMKKEVVRDGLGGVAHSHIFSVWWNGGFRTVPYYKNSIGLLSELASARLATPIEVSPERLKSGRRNYLQKSVINPLPWQGGRWGLPEIVAYHQSMANGLLTWAAHYAADLNADYRRMNLHAMQMLEDVPAGYLIPKDQFDRTALKRLLNILNRHQIGVFQLAEAVNVQETEYPAGSYVVPGDQAFRPMIRSLLERQEYPNVRDYLGREMNPYDITAWNLNDTMNVTVDSVSLADWKEGTVEGKLKEAVLPAESAVTTSTGMTLLPARDLGNYSEAWKILSQGGSLWGEKADAEDGMSDQFLSYDANRDASAMDVQPEADSAAERSLPIPRVGLLQGYFSSMDSGWTSWLFDLVNMPFVDLTSKRILAGDLNSDFDVIVLPAMSERYLMEGRGDNYPEQYRSGLGALGLQRLESFVINGGRLITLESSSQVVIKYFGLPVVDMVRTLDDDDEEFHIPGSILSLEILRESDLSFGLPATTAALFRNSLAFDVEEDNQQIAVDARYASQETLLSGFAVGADLIAGKAAVVTVGHGAGQVVLFAFPPQFRGQTYSTFKLLLNAVLFNEKSPEQVTGKALEAVDAE